MKSSVKGFFTAIAASALICAVSGTLSFAREQPAGAEKSPDIEFRAVRARAFAAFDTDGKGYLDEKGWPGRKRAFRLMDVNRDERITLAEFQSPRNRWHNRTFENLDLDGNRAIDFHEWMDIREDFDKLDRNKDGMIERREFYSPK